MEVAYVCRADAAEDCGGGGVGMMGSRVSRFPPVGGGGDLYLDNISLLIQLEDALLWRY